MSRGEDRIDLSAAKQRASGDVNEGAMQYPEEFEFEAAE